MDSEKLGRSFLESRNLISEIKKMVKVKCWVNLAYDEQYATITICHKELRLQSDIPQNQFDAFYIGSGIKLLIDNFNHRVQSYLADKRKES